MFEPSRPIELAVPGMVHAKKHLKHGSLMPEITSEIFLLFVARQFTASKKGCQSTKMLNKIKNMLGKAEAGFIKFYSAKQCEI